MKRAGLFILANGLLGALGCQLQGALVGPNAQVQTASFRSDVVPVLSEHCASCHTLGTPGAAGVPMFSARGEPLYAAIRVHFYHMKQAIIEGTMPRNKPGSVPAHQVDLLAAWWEAGMPNN
jgi:mono/diheme cytochrome c family protein